MPMSPDAARMVQNVLAGLTAGGGRADGRPVRFTKDVNARKILAARTKEFIDKVPCATDAQRTHFIRKLAAFVVRRGSHHWYHVDFREGVNWFSTHPDDLLTRLSFGGAVRLGIRALRETVNLQHRCRKEACEIAMHRPEPPCPVIFREGEWALLELIHPMHLVRAGRSADNCLAVAPKRSQPNFHYWRNMADGSLRLFTISRGKRLACVFAVANQALNEWEFVWMPKGLEELLPRAYAALEAFLGPVEDELFEIICEGEPVSIVDFRDDMLIEGDDCEGV